MADCKTGILVGGVCDDQTSYPVPSEGAPSFYTTWSMYACFAGCFLAVVFAALSLASKSFPHSVFATHPATTWVCTILMVVSAACAVNSIGVLLASQLLLADNFKLVTNQSNQPNQPVQPVQPDQPDQPRSLSQPFFKSIMQVNFKAHIVPALLGVLIVMILPACLYKTNLPHLPNQWAIVSACIFVLVALFAFIWMAVPVENRVFADKINFVYNSPDMQVFAWQFVGVAFLSALFGLAIKPVGLV